MDFWSYLYQGKSKAAVAEDADPNGVTPTLPVGFSKEKHNKIFHPHGRHEGDTCKYDTMAEQEADAKGDELGMNDAKTPVQKEEPKPSNKREKIKNLILKKRKDLGEGAEREAERMIDEILKMKSSKERKAALHWVCKGAIRMPEDAPKVTEAIQYGERAKGKGNTDPMSYDSPMAMVNALHEFKPKEKAIDPDTVPELSDKKELPMGVTTYLVQDDPYGQQAMRRIINTHWGEDANPWCLLHGDGHGNLSDGSNGEYDAAYYWKKYSALPKRVAFKDGKLLAFMATENDSYDPFDADPDSIDEDMFPEYVDEYNKYCNSHQDFGYYPFGTWMYDHHRDVLDKLNASVPEQWWDRNDSPHDGIPIGNMPIPNDIYGRWSDFELQNDEPKPVGSMHKGEYLRPGYIKWNDRTGMVEEKSLLDGEDFVRCYYGDDGVIDRVDFYMDKRPTGIGHRNVVCYIFNDAGEIIEAAGRKGNASFTANLRNGIGNHNNYGDDVAAEAARMIEDNIERAKRYKNNK